MAVVRTRLLLLSNGLKKVCQSTLFCLQIPAVVVSEKGRQKVIAKKCKNVHAVARGILVSVDKPVIADTSREITYLPYDHHSFFYAETRGTGEFEDVHTSPFVQCLGKKLYEPS